LREALWFLSLRRKVHLILDGRRITA